MKIIAKPGKQQKILMASLTDKELESIQIIEPFKVTYSTIVSDFGRFQDLADSLMKQGLKIK